MHHPKTIIVLGCLAAISAGLILLGCQKKTPPVVIPQGPVTVTGFLKPVPLSLVRRGTHVVVSQGEELYFAQSSAVPLSQYEENAVTMSGTLSTNTDPKEFPVLTVTNIVSHTQDMQSVYLSDFGLRIDLPPDWEKEEETGTGSVHFTSSGSLRSTLTIARSPLQSLPAGTPVTVDGERAVRVIPQGGTDQIVYILRMVMSAGKTHPEITSLTFTPGDGEDSLASPAIFLKILKSVRFDRAKENSSAASSYRTGSGTSLSGQPCGGSAGILCPNGFYCAITDVMENIGICVKAGL